MKAVKGNKEYIIEESQKKSHIDAGYDVYSDSGEHIAYGRGKTVPYGDHMKAIKEIETLREKISELEVKLAEYQSASEKKVTKKASE